MLKDWWSQYDRVWVTRNDELSNDLLKHEHVVYGYFPENRHIINACKNFILAVRTLRKIKPDAVFSMGAGIAPPFLLAAKIMGIKTIFMETFISIPRATLSGRLVYFWVDVFLVQNKELLKIYPRAKYWGSVL